MQKYTFKFNFNKLSKNRYDNYLLTLFLFLSLVVHSDDITIFHDTATLFYSEVHNRGKVWAEP